MLRSWKCTPEFLFFNLGIKITGITPEFSQENTRVICIRDKNLLQDHFSNIHTSTDARDGHELHPAAQVTRAAHHFLIM